MNLEATDIRDCDRHVLARITVTFRSDKYRCYGKLIKDYVWPDNLQRLKGNVLWVSNLNLMQL